MKPNIETFLGCDCDYNDADIALFGAPFDSTTSFRPGARFGPRAMRGESYGLESYSPYADRDMGEIRVFDCGDLELPFGNAEKALASIEAHAETLLRDGKRPVMLGGEHLVTLGGVRAVAKRYPDVHILHFDAHADLLDAYMGERLSHAAVMRRAWELLGDGRIHQFGIRSGLREEFEFARAHTRLRRFDFEGLSETVDALRGKPVYVSIDLDVLDPSIFPGTGTPEPGGVPFTALLRAIEALGALRVVAADLNELAPAYDASGVSTAAACKALREFLLRIGEGQ